MRNEPDIERLLAAFSHKKVDRVPNWEIMICERNVDYLLGSEVGTTTEFLDPKLYVQLAQKIGMDAISFRYVWDFGIPGLIQDWADLEKAIPHPDYDAIIGRLRATIRATAGTGIGVCYWAGSSFAHTYNKLGFENFMIKLHDDPLFVERVMDLYCDYFYNVVLRASEEGIAFFYIGDDLCGKSGPLVSPRVLERLWYPRAQRIIEPARRKGIPLLFHCDGGLGPVIPYLIKLGFSAIHPIEPYSNDIYEIKKRYGKDLCLVGNIDIAGVLAFGTPADVVQDVREHIARLSPGGGYVLCSSHSIINDVPPENFLAMIDTGHTTPPAD